MRVVIAGSREGIRYRDVAHAIRESGWADQIAVVLCGGARGADQHGKRWADDHGRVVEMHYVREDEWEQHGKAAGPMRNRRMAEAADAAIIVWDGESRGSRNMIFEARRVGIPTFVVEARATAPHTEEDGR